MSTQLLACWWARASQGLEPDLYYLHRLYEPARWRRRHGVVRTREFSCLVKHACDTTAARLGTEGRAVLLEKRKFAAWCARHRVASVPILLELEDERVVAGTTDAWPAADLFSKPTNSYGGTGAQRWHWDAAHAAYRSHDGALLDADGVVAALARRSATLGRPIIVQPALSLHPDVAALSGGGLATVRLVTIQYLDGRVRAVGAAYRMPVGDAVIDAFSHGGIAAPVDLATGRLADAVSAAAAAAGEIIARHPDTGARIAGTLLPHWSQVVALGLRMHTALPSLIPVVGWDVALTPDGPVVLEGNVPPSAPLAQVPSGILLGETEVVGCVLEYLRASEMGRRSHASGRPEARAGRVIS